MRVEVEIGTIALDALPEGLDAATLRRAVVAELEALLRTNGGPPLAPARLAEPGTGAAPSAPPSPRTGLAAEIAAGIHGGLVR